MDNGTQTAGGGGKGTEPPADTEQAQQAAVRWRLFWAAAYVAAFVLIYFMGGRILDADPKGDLGAAIAKLIPLMIILFGSLVFVQVYTRPITTRDERVEAPRSWFVFAYVFMVSALILAIVPFTVPMKMTAQDLAVRPISVLLGCVDDPGKLLPAELRCGTAAAAQGAGGADARKTADAVPQNQWILNIGGSIEKDGSIQKNAACGTNCYVVRGGLSVPLYVVIIALIGGAISLTRRVPEYQKQAAPDYKQTEANQQKLELPLVREYLVFQIVQYVSAPLVAITAYYAIKPTDTPSSVALAFVSGFASEPILLMIRGVIEKVTPKPAKVTAKGSVSVGVKKATVAVTDAEVSIVGLPTLKAKIDSDKRYVFDSVPAGEHAIEVKYPSDDAKTTKAETVKVNVVDGKVATSEVKLA